MLAARVIGVACWRYADCGLAECPDNGNIRAILGICSWHTLIVKCPRLDKLPCFKLLDFVGQNMETVKLA